MKRVVRAVITVTLLLGLLAGMLPLETLASGKMCTLSCCAGRASHAAGSCMDGSCHAAIGISKNAHASKKPTSEEFCGLAAFMRGRLSRKPAPPLFARPLDTRSQRQNLSSATVTKPCSADCGSCGFGFSSDDRNHIVIGERAQPDAPHRIELTNFDFAFLALNALVSQCGPRAPPMPS